MLENSNAAIQKIRTETQQDSRNRNKSTTSRESLSAIRSSEEYSELEAKIEELEREFNSEVEKLLAKNKELALELKKTQESNAELAGTNRSLRK